MEIGHRQEAQGGENAGGNRDALKCFEYTLIRRGGSTLRRSHLKHAAGYHRTACCIRHDLRTGERPEPARDNVLRLCHQLDANAFAADPDSIMFHQGVHSFFLAFIARQC